MAIAMRLAGQPVAWFRNLKVGHKLLLSFAALLALTTAIGGFSIAQMARVNSASTDISRESLPAVHAVLVLESHLQQFRMEELQHLLSVNDEEIARRDARLLALRQKISADLEVCGRHGGSTESQATFLEFQRIWQLYLHEHSQIVALSRQNMSEEAKALLRGQSETLHQRIVKVMERLVEINVERGKARSVAATGVYETSRLLTIMLLGLCLAVGAMLAWWMTRMIVAPLKAAAFLSQRVAAADLTASVDSASDDEIGQLLQALKSMTASLRTIVCNVRNAAESILAHSGRMVEENADLALRMNQQAACLDAAARSLHGLSGALQRDAQQARSVSELVCSSASDTLRPAGVVGEVIHRMRDMQCASNQIGNITATIEGIAFQTNLLAINAAVEAARAAEHGRGFAVVAEAVRALSHRSGTASSEIKGLVGNSVEQVRAGTALPHQAGVAMNRIEQSLQPATAVMAGISQGSVHHAQGIAHLSRQVSELDASTHGDLLLVERAAASARQLQEHARGLAQAVSIFKV